VIMLNLGKGKSSVQNEKKTWGFSICNNRKLLTKSTGSTFFGNQEI
jgi:hypothetical protein